MPVEVLHVPATWHGSEFWQTTGVPTHEPLWQTSLRVQALLSLHERPLNFASAAQEPQVLFLMQALD
jgi:hypothetical protein